ncbi:hypothetical protein [Flavobacterium silvaticum]|uniref:Uncharacterized protein n=1 Tax=Flavobacterium silvaticum TaxID=1852020 RepID=A0A972JJ05_9FLAO|nr:hypothetical protein [Flavobacterium silvaticum]NMH29610.1 hypothetical protein [Flavobacterium silvaticum]
MLFRNTVFILFFFLMGFSCLTAQQVIDSQRANELGLGMEILDTKYKSALHEKPEKAVFKTEEEQQKLTKAYTDFLQQIGAFLSSHQFHWDTQVRGFNRIYIKPDGSVDYFIYRLPDDLPVQKKLEFEKLLSQFLTDHKFPVSSPVPFAQCSSTVWSN